MSDGLVLHGVANAAVEETQLCKTGKKAVQIELYNIFKLPEEEADEVVEDAAYVMVIKEKPPKPPVDNSGVG